MRDRIGTVEILSAVDLDFGGEVDPGLDHRRLRRRHEGSVNGRPPLAVNP